jgi:hypothetical protein
VLLPLPLVPSCDAALLPLFAACATAVEVGLLPMPLLPSHDAVLLLLLAA